MYRAGDSDGGGVQVPLTFRVSVSSLFLSSRPASVVPFARSPFLLRSLSLSRCCVHREGREGRYIGP